MGTGINSTLKEIFVAGLKKFDEIIKSTLPESSRRLINCKTTKSDKMVASINAASLVHLAENLNHRSDAGLKKTFDLLISHINEKRASNKIRRLVDKAPLPTEKLVETRKKS